MRIINLKEEKEYASFAEDAAKAFQKNSALTSYSKNGIKEDELLALRWNNASVLVLKVSDMMEPSLYQVRSFGMELLPKITPVD
jgi:hypothetical protein